MPLAIIYAIGILLTAALAFFAPHTHGLCMILAEIYSACLIVSGTLELLKGPRKS